MNKESQAGQPSPNRKSTQQAVAIAKKISQLPRQQAQVMLQKIQKNNKKLAAKVMGVLQQLQDKGQAKAKQQGAMNKKKQMMRKVKSMAKKLAGLDKENREKQLAQLKKRNPQFAAMVQKAIEQLKVKQDAATGSPRSARVNAERRKIRKGQQQENKKGLGSLSLEDIIGDNDKGNVLRSVAKNHFLNKINIQEHLDEIDESTSELYKIVQNYLEADENKDKKDDAEVKKEDHSNGY